MTKTYIANFLDLVSALANHTAGQALVYQQAAIDFALFLEINMYILWSSMINNTEVTVLGININVLVL